MNTLKKGSRGADVATLQHKLNLIADGIFGPITEEAVKTYQKEAGLEADGIVGPRTWAALGMAGARRNITKIILHCADTPEGKDFTVEQIRLWHLQRGFADIGYHWVVYRDGSIHPGRREDKVGAHCLGQNTCSIGICYIGGRGADGKPKDTRTEEQKKAIRGLVAELQQRYPHATVHGHKEFAAKACPCFEVCDL